jgi:hypothetical protein
MLMMQKVVLTMASFLAMVAALFGIFEVDYRLKFKAVALNKTIHTLTVDIPGCIGNIGKVSSDDEIPIFILNRDRLSNLQNALRSYKRLSSLWYVIICDHNSTYPPMLKYLNELTLSGTEVWRIQAQDWGEGLREMSNKIVHYLQFRPNLRHYVITDPDIILNGTSPDMLLFFAAVLEACPRVDVIGPALQISNIPQHYAKKTVVYKHESQFWTSVPATANWKEVSYHLVFQPIDTTFAMRRRTQPFQRLGGSMMRAYGTSLISLASIIGDENIS